MMLLLALALTYYLGVRVGLAFTPADSAVSLLWPPNAVVLTALLFCPPRRWVWPLLAVLPAHLLAEVSLGVPLAMAACWYISNISEALLGAGILFYFLGEAPRFDRVHLQVRFEIVRDANDACAALGNPAFESQEWIGEEPAEASELVRENGLDGEAIDVLHPVHERYGELRAAVHQLVLHIDGGVGRQDNVAPALADRGR